MSSLLLLLILVPVFIIGLQLPVAAFCTYMWLDLVMPQLVVYGITANLPFSLFSGVVCLISMVINLDKISKPNSIAIPVLLSLFAIWITVTTCNAMFPIPAWEKWNWAFKTLMITVSMVFVFRDRDDFEILQLTMLVSIAYFVISLGSKSLLDGGGYGLNLIRGQVNYGLYESSTLAAVSGSMIPIVLHLKRHTQILPNWLKVSVLWYGFILLLVATMIGTYSRTGLVCLCYLLVMYFLLTKRKLNFLLLAGIGGVVLISGVSESWVERMSTLQIADREASALGRLVVWQWTIDFVASHPMGGGFNAYLANETLLYKYSDSVTEFNTAKAFHSIFFEVLGEHGYVGLIIFLSIIALVLLKLFMMYKTASKNKDMWLVDAASTTMLSISTLLVGAMFVGIAFRPYIYYYVVLTLVLERVHNANIKERRGH